MERVMREILERTQSPSLGSCLVQVTWWLYSLASIAFLTRSFLSGFFFLKKKNLSGNFIYGSFIYVFFWLVLARDCEFSFL